MCKILILSEAAHSETLVSASLPQLLNRYKSKTEALKSPRKTRPSYPVLWKADVCTHGTGTFMHSTAYYMAIFPVQNHNSLRSTATAFRKKWRSILSTSCPDSLYTSMAAG